MQQWHTNWLSLNQQPHLQNKVLVSSVYIVKTLFITHCIQQQKVNNTDILQYLCIKCILLARGLLCYRSKMEKHKYGTMSRAGFENEMCDPSPRELHTARPLNFYVYEKNTAAIFFRTSHAKAKKGDNHK